MRPTSTETRNRMWCTKMLKYLKRNRNRVRPVRTETPGCIFFEVKPQRVLRVLRPELKSGRFYEPPAADRPESIIDNFYSRWARRPHPSDNCRCSFRQSVNSSRLSTHEEAIISQEIQRIRTSLCEAERSGKAVEELEQSLALDLEQLQARTSSLEAAEIERKSLAEQCCSSKATEVCSKIEPLDEQVRQRIVKDLDRYISDLLDEILNDTIRALARSDNPFSRVKSKEADQVSSSLPPTFDISFAFHSSDDGEDVVKSNVKEDAADERGYVNRGFVGSASDPDSLDFHLRHRLNTEDVNLENADCIDSGINSVETVELQPEQEHNLEQSLMDIIDAKLGGSSIGKSLENLGMEIDSTDDEKIPKTEEASKTELSGLTIQEVKDDEKCESTIEKKPTIPEEKIATIKETLENSSSERTSKSLDDIVEEPVFNSLRLEFKQSDSPPKENNDKPCPKVASRFSKTITLIRRRLVRRLNDSRRKRVNPKHNNLHHHHHNNNNNNNNEPVLKSRKQNSTWKNTAGRASQHELEDYRRRFPVPDISRHQQHQPDLGEDGEVTLRKRNRKPTIVFLHGFGSSADAFQPQLRYFAELGYPCVAPDLLGHGLSSAPRGARHYRFKRLLEDVETVLQQYAFKPGQKCVIVAHNYGCSFATALAQKYADSVHQLVLISGGGPTPLAPPLHEGTGHCCLRASLAPFLFCGMHRAVLYSARGRQHPYCGPEESPWPSNMSHVLQGMSWPDGDHVFHRRICTPTLLVHGLRDNSVSLVQECQMERTMAKAFLEAIPTAGHMPMTDCPEQLNHMIHCFIDLWKNKKW